MFTTFKNAAVIAVAVVAAHAAIGSASFSALQGKADQAVMPVVTAERIEVRPMQVVKMDRIEVVAKNVACKPAPSQFALTRWNAAA